MPIVPSLSDAAKADERIFGGVGHDIVGVVSVQVRCGIDQPRKVQDDAISQAACHEKGCPEILSPKVRCDLCWHDKAHVEREPRIESLLEHDERVFGQVRKVHVASRLDDFRVLLDEQPPHVGKEESPHGVVWIGMGF